MTSAEFGQVKKDLCRKFFQSVTERAETSWSGYSSGSKAILPNKKGTSTKPDESASENGMVTVWPSTITSPSQPSPCGPFGRLQMPTKIKLIKNKYEK